MRYFETVPLYLNILKKTYLLRNLIYKLLRTWNREQGPRVPPKQRRGSIYFRFSAENLKGLHPLITEAVVKSSWTTEELMLTNCGAGEDSRESLGLQDQTSQSQWQSTLNIHRTDWCWSSNLLATWCEQPSHWKRPRCWEILRAREEGGRGWDGWMASAIQWTWTWANSRRWWGTGKPGMLWSRGGKESNTTEQLNSSNPEFWVSVHHG